MKPCSHLVCCLLVVVLLGVYNTVAVYECMAGRWGSGCGKKCGECMGGGEFCQVYDGLCANGCASGYKGHGCNSTCGRGQYGPYCREKCGYCNNKRPYCNKETGHCDLGCKLGYQRPFCKLPCPHLTFGEDCARRCNCTETCGCDPETGVCTTGCDQNTYIKYRQEPKFAACINQHALKQVIKKYKPPDVLEIPWLSILSIMGLLFFFVLSNFIWWWFWVRQVKAPEDKIEIDRSHKPDHINEHQDSVTVLSRIRRKLGLDETSKEPESSIARRRGVGSRMHHPGEGSFMGSRRRESHFDMFHGEDIKEIAHATKVIKRRQTVDFGMLQVAMDDSPFANKVFKRRESTVDAGVLLGDIHNRLKKRQSAAGSSSANSRASSATDKN